MFNLLSRRLLGVLQLTRMALVFTAIADSFCTLLLLSNSPHAAPGHVLSPARFVAIAFMSIGLYGFGMSLNDIIDRRRDRQIAAHRPLPSGRVGVATNLPFLRALLQHPQVIRAEMDTAFIERELPNLVNPQHPLTVLELAGGAVRERLVRKQDDGLAVPQVGDRDEVPGAFRDDEGGEEIDLVGGVGLPVGRAEAGKMIAAAVPGGSRLDLDAMEAREADEEIEGQAVAPGLGDDQPVRSRVT